MIQTNWAVVTSVVVHEVMSSVVTAQPKVGVGRASQSIL